MSIQFRTRSETFKIDPETLTGACCNFDGTCSVETLKKCYENGGRFNPNQSCEKVDCDRGVCCKEGLCYSVTRLQCEAMDGFWAGQEFDCHSYDCCSSSVNTRAELQACCFGVMDQSTIDSNESFVCKDLKPCECLNVGGTPRGPSSNCATVTAAGGCGVTGATSHGVCCTDGICRDKDDRLFKNGYTPGDCSALGGYWGGSGSTCGSGTSFDTSWPCSWPTGACCFGQNPVGGITYCDNGKTYGSCLDPEPGGSGGGAWQIGVTCGEIGSIDGVNCAAPRSGVCCIPERFTINGKQYTYDYICYHTTATACPREIGSFVDDVDGDVPNCETFDCCEYHAGDEPLFCDVDENCDLLNPPPDGFKNCCCDGICHQFQNDLSQPCETYCSSVEEETYEYCTYGPNGRCCQTNTATGEITCSNLTAYECHLIGSDPNNDISIIFEETDSEDPCSEDGACGIVADKACCCVWRSDGTYFESFDIELDQPCPPVEYNNNRYFSQLKYSDCQTSSCENISIGACCKGSQCLNTTRSRCSEIVGTFYENSDCNDCEGLPCCFAQSNTKYACGIPDITGTPTEGGGGGVSCIDYLSFPSMDFSDEFIFDIYGLYRPDLEIDQIYLHQNDLTCESCTSDCGRGRGNCCWYGHCIPNVRESECLSYGGQYSNCTGEPFRNIEESLSIDNPCTDEVCNERIGSFPKAPINLRANSTHGTEGIEFRRGRTDSRSAYNNEYALSGENQHLTSTPPHVRLTWDDEYVEGGYRNRRRMTGIPCVNNNKIGCEKPSVLGTCCVMETCENLDDFDGTERCYRCYENKSECECAELAGSSVCNSVRNNQIYMWNKDKPKCSDCSCNDPEEKLYQVNDCEENKINRPDEIRLGDQ